MKNIMTSIVVAGCLAFAAYGRSSHHGPVPRAPIYGPRIHHSPPPHPSHHHHHHHHGAFWTGVGIGLIGSAFAPQPPVVIQATQPVLVPSTWVPPVYGERPVYRAGIYVGTERYVITPGYWR